MVNGFMIRPFAIHNLNRNNKGRASKAAPARPGKDLTREKMVYSDFFFLALISITLTP